MLKKHVFGSFNLNKSEKHRLSFEDIFLGTLDTYTKKMNPPSAVLGGGVHGKVSWLIAYMFVNLNIPSFGELLRKYVYSFRNRLESSKNSIIRGIYLSQFLLQSGIWVWWRDILSP